MKVQEKVSLADLTTMKLGGAADYVVTVESLADVREAYQFAKEKRLPVFILGGGANSLGRDEGFHGVIILDRLKGIEVIDETSDEVVVRGMGGENWDKFVEFCSERGYSGIELLSGIPGTLGAAPVQNIGAYGQEIAQTIDHVDAYDTVTDEMVVIGRDEMKMGYRSTIFNQGALAGRYFVTAVTLVLENDDFLQPPFYHSLQKYLDEHQITDYSPSSLREAVLAVRGGKLGWNKPCAGSFFKNIYFEADAPEYELAVSLDIPVYDTPDGRKMINAGKLIEKAGFSGKLLHGIRVPENVTLVLTNESATSFSDLAKARAEIRTAVREQFGFELEQEPMEIVSGGSESGQEPVKNATSESGLKQAKNMRASGELGRGQAKNMHTSGELGREQAKNARASEVN